MRRLVLLAAAVLACGSNPSTIPAGDFSGPTALAIAPLVDRDLLFIANQGSNELRAMTLCHTPNASSCPTAQDLQFLPAPIRVFPASILTGKRPLRLAGLPLSDGPPDTSGNFIANHGAVLVAALDVAISQPADAGVADGGLSEPVPALQLFDAANLLAASQGNSPAADPRAIQLPGSPVDVVASDVPNKTVTAFAVSQAANATGGTLTVLAVSVDSAGLAQATRTKQCTLDFNPTRLALIPGNSDLDPTQVPNHVYVADGTPGGTAGGIGDGVVEVSVPDIPPIPVGGGPIPACSVFQRIPASDPLDSPRRARPLGAIAISPPALVDQNTAFPAGRYMLGVTLDDPALCANHAVGICDPVVGSVPGALCVDQGMQNCGAGRIVLFNRATTTVPFTLSAAPAPGFSGQPRRPAEPLRPPSEAREVAFMGRKDCPTSTPPPCTSVRVGLGIGITPVAIARSVIGVATTTDGSTLFIDVINGRFFEDHRDSDTLNIGIPPVPSELSRTLTPQSAPGVTPSDIGLASPEVTSSNPFVPGHKQLTGWMNAGVTRSSEWDMVWHPTLPGLAELSGNLTRNLPGDPITLTLPPGKDLTPWISSPELQLGAPSACTLPYPQCVGDFVRVVSFSTNATCGDLATLSAGSTIDIPILAVHPGSLDLQAVPGFDPNPSCFASGTVGGTFRVHAGNSTAGGWVVLEGLPLPPPTTLDAPLDLDVLARIPHGTELIVTGPRFDYPLLVYPIGPGNDPPGPVDIALAFSMIGTEPTVAGTRWTLFVTSGLVTTSIRDQTFRGSPGYAGPALVYSSTRRPGDEIVFTAVTGSDSLMYLIPAQIGVVGYFQMFY